MSSDLAAATLREVGQRVTRARVAVLECLLAAGEGHLSADEVLARVGDSRPPVHRATVYRTLESLTAAGVLRHVHLDRGLTAYHVAVPTAAPRGEHLHAQCGTCGRVVDLPASVLGDTAKRVRAASGFRLDPGHVALSGECADCADTLRP